MTLRAFLKKFPAGRMCVSAAPVRSAAHPQPFSFLLFFVYLNHPCPNRFSSRRFSSEQFSLKNFFPGPLFFLLSFVFLPWLPPFNIINIIGGCPEKGKAFQTLFTDGNSKKGTAISIQATAKKTLHMPSPANWKNRVSRADDRAKAQRPALDGGMVS